MGEKGGVEEEELCYHHLFFKVEEIRVSLWAQGQGGLEVRSSDNGARPQGTKRDRAEAEAQPWKE